MIDLILLAALLTGMTVIARLIDGKPRLDDEEWDDDDDDDLPTNKWSSS